MIFDPKMTPILIIWIIVIIILLILLIKKKKVNNWLLRETEMTNKENSYEFDLGEVKYYYTKNEIPLLRELLKNDHDLDIIVIEETKKIVIKIDEQSKSDDKEVIIII